MSPLVVFGASLLVGQDVVAVSLVEVLDAGCKPEKNQENEDHVVHHSFETFPKRYLKIHLYGATQ